MKKLEMKTPQGWITAPKERLSYYLYFAGQNVIYNLVATYLTTYIMFTFASDADATGVAPGVLTAGVMLIVKIWDAVNDAVFGVIFDKVKFKSGLKFIPWLKVSLVFIPLTTIVLFAIPSSLSTTVKLVWLAVSYILWDTAYTLCDVPIFGIITSMTENLEERGSILSYKSIWSGVGSGISLILATVLVGENVGMSYTVVAVISAVVALIVMIPACFYLKERYNGESEEEFTIKRMFKYLTQNKYLLVYYLGYFFYSAANVQNALNLFVSFYLFKNSQFSLVVQAVALIPSAIFAFLVPKLIRKYDKMKIFRICTIITIITSIIMWVIGYNSLVVFTIIWTIRAIPTAIMGIMLYLFTPDCAEFGKFKSGIEARGITFSIQTFMVKLTAAISTALPLLVLGLKKSEWVSVSVESFEDLAELAAQGAAGGVQTPHALNVLWFLFAMVPAIGFAIAYLIWTRYKLNDKDVQIMADCNTGKITRQEAEASLSRKY